MKIYLNKTAQKMLFSYYEGVDWAETLCEENPNPKNSPTDDYISLSDEEKNRIHNKIITWDYYRGIELLVRAANLGHRKAQYILFDRKDTSSFPYPDKLTDEEFYEIGVETKDMNFINRAFELGNLKAKTFIQQNQKFY